MSVRSTMIAILFTIPHYRIIPAKVANVVTVIIIIIIIRVVSNIPLCKIPISIYIYIPIINRRRSVHIIAVGWVAFFNIVFIFTFGDILKFLRRGMFNIRTSYFNTNSSSHSTIINITLESTSINTIHCINGYELVHFRGYCYTSIIRWQSNHCSRIRL